MPAHFARFSVGVQSPGLILLREATPIATAIEELTLIWSASEAEEWKGRLVWIPTLRTFRLPHDPRYIRKNEHTFHSRPGSA